jgi:DNA-binding LytR/AlgR family response regulator
MFEFLDKPYPFDNVLRDFLKIGFGIALGLFLFMLFFQPFELDNTDFNNYILTIAGFSGINYLLIIFLLIILPWIFPKRLNRKNWDLKREIIVQFLLWVLNSVAWTFYTAYVADVKLSMYLTVRIVILSLAPPMIILLIKEIRSLKMQLQDLKAQHREKRQENVLLISENRSEKLSINSSELILVRSAENYVEIHYLSGGTGTRKLLRTTFKSIEDQLKPYSQMIRCHRTCIINMDHVVKLYKDYGRTHLKMNGIEELIPVSRQYLLGIKNALGSN